MENIGTHSCLHPELGKLTKIENFVGRYVKTLNEKHYRYFQGFLMKLKLDCSKHLLFESGKACLTPLGNLTLSIRKDLNEIDLFNKTLSEKKIKKDPGWVIFKLPRVVEVTALQTYHLVCRGAEGDDDNYYQLELRLR